MDTSEQYVKMCKEAKEIQPEYLNYGDYYIWASGNWYIWSDDNQSKRTKERIWFPRQDQLQEMVVNIYDDIHHLLCEFASWHDKKFVDLFYKNNFASAEQLWLAFVMGKKFNKIWNGEEWING